MSLMRSMLTVGGHTMIGRILGYVRDGLSANLLGAGILSDAFLYAVKIPGLFRRLFAEGSFNSSFVPIFAGTVATQGKQQAKIFAEHAITILAIFLTLLVLLVEFFMSDFISFMAPGLLKTPETFRYAIEFTHITFPFIIFISMSAILGGILNSVDRFAAPASAQSIGNLLIIFFFIFLVGSTETPGHLAAWGNLGAGISQFFWLYFFCAYAGIILKFRIPKFTPQIKEFFKKLLPGMIGSGVVHINLFVDLWLSSSLPEKGITYFNYAERVSQLPLSIIGVAIGIALLPMLTKQIRQDKLKEAIFTQNRATEFVLLCTIPIAIGLMIYSNAFVGLIYGHGKFLEHSGNIPQTAYALCGFCIGIPAYVLMKVFSSTFFARKDTTTPVIIGLISVISNFVLNWYLMQYYQHVGIAIGTSIASWINALLLAASLKNKKMMIIDQQLIKNTPKILLSATIMGTVIYYIEPYFSNYAPSIGFFGKALTLSLLVSIATITFLIPAYLLKCIDTKSMTTSNLD